MSEYRYIEIGFTDESCTTPDYCPIHKIRDDGRPIFYSLMTNNWRPYWYPTLEVMMDNYSAVGCHIVKELTEEEALLAISKLIVAKELTK